jgi:mono/diheme cytochrome c family protein
MVDFGDAARRDASGNRRVTAPTRWWSALLALLPITAGVAVSAPAGPRPGSAPSFEKEVRPLLEANCLRCHGAENPMGGLELRTPAAILRGGQHGPAVTRGLPGRSTLLRRAADGSMPPGNARKLNASELDILRRWIAAGAPARDATAAGRDPRSHWAFQPVVRPRVPTIAAPRAAAWVRSPVDAFFLARHPEAHREPPKEAEPRTLLRRLYLDLLGLPPTVTEQETYLSDRAPGAYERLVDRLLARPEYGERWGRRWLDVVRYGDSNGYERDGAKPHAWRYRDWVIRSLNADKPYDRFVQEQIAGDELEGTNAETQIATTFLRLGTWDDEPADPAVDRYDQLDDVLGATATAFMGVTLRCARCHDHKFEPFTQREYYQVLSVFQPLKRPQDGRADLDRMVGTEAELKAFREAEARVEKEASPSRSSLDELKRVVQERLFTSGKSTLSANAIAAFRARPGERTSAQRDLVRNNTGKLDSELRPLASAAETARWQELQGRINAIEAKLPAEPPRAYIWFEEGSSGGATVEPTRVLYRGNPVQPKEAVQPAVPAVLSFEALSPPAARAQSSGRRLWLARWLTDPRHPLTARVAVNRIWQGHFGEGIVASENDFGVMGQRPSDPKLLDWLASELVARGWSMKQLHRLIVLSSTYRAGHAGRKSGADAAVAGGRPSRRLEGEVIRDSMLAVSGKLNPRREGPGIYPELPRAVLEGQSRPGDGWGKSDEQEASRRSVYIFSKRSLAVPELELLDSPDTTSSCEERSVSTIAPQALTFMNGQFVNRQATYFADRLRREAGDEPAAQIGHAFRLALCRPPTPAELAESQRFLARQQAQIVQDRRGVIGGANPSPAPDRAALISFCRVLFNTNEFFYTH